jgi:hypothetical protein
MEANAGFADVPRLNPFCHESPGPLMLSSNSYNQILAMNRSHVRGALADFIGDDGLRVTALSGDWGVGKTCLWKDFARGLQLPETLKGSAYASLFGAESLSELRLRGAMGYARRPLTWSQSVAGFVDWLKTTASKGWRLLNGLLRRGSGVLVGAQRFINWRTGPLVG